MPLPLVEMPPEESVSPRDRRVARSTARAFAAAISALLIATLVVARSGSALEAEGTVAGTNFAAGTVSLVDDDRGRSLFDLSDMAPGRPVVRCIQVVYDGSILPVDLTLQAEGDGALLPYLETTIEEGTGGAFTSCDGFDPSRVVYGGTLSTLTTRSRLPIGTINNTGDGMSFRVTFDLADEQDALGKTASADFVWEVTPT
ncbi:MAG: hypothetical protein OEW42_20360 [Acidimicrobiia bacterium]|nr:hypothetical protein [Acidimicrobiia bacterium]